jgi:hypothetical protein
MNVSAWAVGLAPYAGHANQPVISAMSEFGSA